jgi:Domain of unknown function (DUF4440)
VAVPEVTKQAGPAASPVFIAAAMHPALRWGGLIGIVAGAAIVALALPKAQPKAQAMAVDEARVLAADKALQDAIRAGDKTAARRILALQFTFVDANGKDFTRKDLLADLKSVAAASGSDVKVRSYGVVATVTGQHKSAHDDDVFFLDVWVKQKGAWRVLLMQEVPLASAEPGGEAVAALRTPAAEPQRQPDECKNPCESLPYRVRSPAEQDVINTFQATSKAVVARDAAAWGKNVADEFMLYATDRSPVTRPERIAAIERQKEDNIAATVGAVQTMRLAVYGDSAVMTARESPPSETSRPSYRSARIWVRRDGRWLMATSLHTDVK